MPSAPLRALPACASLGCALRPPDGALREELRHYRRARRVTDAELRDLRFDGGEGGSAGAGVGGGSEGRQTPVSVGAGPSTSAHGAAWDANGEAGANADSPGDEEAPQLRLEDYAVPEHCIPVLGNVLEMDEVWDKLAAVCEFDVIMMVRRCERCWHAAAPCAAACAAALKGKCLLTPCASARICLHVSQDPPWQLACANPTRGVAIAYQQLQDRFIADLPVPRLQPKGGLLCVWTINAKYAWTIQQMQQWGYDLVDEIVWVKMTVNRRIAKSHGYYLQHAKEVCLVGLKGEEPAALRRGVISDIIWSKRRGQSQKPDDIYQIIEDLVPGGRFLEIFGRKNNLRDHWVTIGNEVTGQNHLIDKIEEETAKQAPGGGEVVGAAAGRPSIEEGKGGAAAAAAAQEAAATAVAS